MITGVAAPSGGLTTPYEEILDTWLLCHPEGRKYPYGDYPIRNAGFIASREAPMAGRDMAHAIEDSCNVFFTLADRLGSTCLMSNAAMFGLGQSTASRCLGAYRLCGPDRDQ